MPLFGFHASIAGGLQNAVISAHNEDAATFQFFLGSPRTWKYSEFSDTQAEQFKELALKYHLQKSVVHLNYLPNFANPIISEKSLTALRTEIFRCDALQVPYLVLHIGSHKGMGIEKGIESVVQNLNTVLQENFHVQILLETSAGQKNSVGSKFAEIGEIIGLLEHPNRVGVCFDTCHVFAAGYDIRTESAWKSTVEVFDQEIGVGKIKVVHANDSKGELGNGKDRHEHIGMGYIGLDGFRAMVQRPEFVDLPIIIETPGDERRPYLDNMRILKNISQK